MAKKAFSLIELSLVILIIGVLIAAVAQGSRLVAKNKLNAARALTQSSPVNDIDGVSFWVESTLEESFLETQRVDNAPISAWNDINAASNKKKNFSRVTNDTLSVYKESGINNIPSIYFNGSVATSNSTLNIPVILTPSNHFTIFMVEQSLELNISNPAIVFYNGYSGTDGYGYLILDHASGNLRCANFGNVSLNPSETSAQSTSPEIAEISADGVTLSMRINGAEQTIASPLASPNTPVGVATIGTSPNGSQSWNGYISEVIFFEKALEDREKKDVRNYLSKKYNIAVTQ